MDGLPEQKTGTDTTHQNTNNYSHIQDLLTEHTASGTFVFLRIDCVFSAEDTTRLFLVMRKQQPPF